MTLELRGLRSDRTRINTGSLAISPECAARPEGRRIPAIIPAYKASEEAR
jgi:hypothetical protein